ncbi:hypothetical protein FIBSPDRAFT_834749 [Athelia psychrophila]|uniref:Mediator of RNA polymerase II transcription subunit 8 n=1 Tax=Athelia psychrophila TaxID=1759441 RepID=A0A166CMX3_9AGAM|nr:hypothetical protein FIBSPDRAFT_834749 [Fibularhizoctonia sp. CBS 109695]
MSQSSLPPPPLPLSSLESLKFKATQLQESILALQSLIEYGGMHAMPSWPDVLSKYNVLLSQSLNLSVGLAGIAPGTAATGGGAGSGNQLTRIALHPSTSMTDTALDNELIPLLRNQQTTDVLRMENDTVRRLGEKMQTGGVAAILGIGSTTKGEPDDKPTYSETAEELSTIREAHDARVDRAIRAVTMLRDKYDWKARVEVEVEEPEELEWDPRRTTVAESTGDNEEAGGDVDMHDDDGSDDEGESVDDEDTVDAMVVGDSVATPVSVSGSAEARTPGTT